MLTLDQLKPQLEALRDAVASLAIIRTNSAPDSNLRISFHRVNDTPEQIRDLVQLILPTLRIDINYYEVDGDSWHCISAHESRSYLFSIDIYTVHTPVTTVNEEAA